MLRAVDANLNRLGEGLRVLEDVARFVLSDAEIIEQLRQLRHQLADGKASLGLLSARDVMGDLGIQQQEEPPRSDLVSLVRANARRVEESLRVLAEIVPLPPLGWEAATFNQARFKLYDLEKRLVSRLARREKLERLKGLYLVLDVQALRGRDDLAVAAAAIAGGAKAIQLRDKQREKVELLKVAQGLKKLCQEQGALFIINDHLDLALACDADGLHLGQDDLPPAQARRFLAIDKIVGLSTHSVEQAERAQEAGADYIALGSIYPTTSKGSVVVIGVETLRQVRQKVSLPVVAIGGINSANASEAIAAGADAVAVIGAVMGVEDVAKAAQRISSLFEDKPD